jgi:hypothetical protein
MGLRFMTSVEANCSVHEGDPAHWGKESYALGLHTIEGKDPIPFAAYVKLASILTGRQDPEHVASHLFLLLDWNRVSSSENAVNSHMDLGGIFDDALLVYLG